MNTNCLYTQGMIDNNIHMRIEPTSNLFGNLLMSKEEKQYLQNAYAVSCSQIDALNKAILNKSKQIVKPTYNEWLDGEIGKKARANYKAKVKPLQDAEEKKGKKFNVVEFLNSQQGKDSMQSIANVTAIATGTTPYVVAPESYQGEGEDDQSSGGSKIGWIILVVAVVAVGGYFAIKHFNKPKTA